MPDTDSQLLDTCLTTPHTLARGLSAGTSACTHKLTRREKAACTGDKEPEEEC